MFCGPVSPYKFFWARTTDCGARVQIQDRPRRNVIEAVAGQIRFRPALEPFKPAPVPKPVMFAPEQSPASTMPP